MDRLSLPALLSSARRRRLTLYWMVFVLALGATPFNSLRAANVRSSASSSGSRPVEEEMHRHDVSQAALHEDTRRARRRLVSVRPILVLLPVAANPSGSRRPVVARFAHEQEARNGTGCPLLC